jgi:TatD DNase family protein
MHLIDTHAHVCFDAYDEDRDLVLERAFAAGVRKLVHPCCNLEEVKSLITLSDRYRGGNTLEIYSAIGVHPTELNTWPDNAIEFIEEALNNPEFRSRIKAIGEAGLDYYHVTDAAGQAKQREIFLDQIKIAQKYSLPLIVHTRDAWDDTLKILTENYLSDRNARSGVLHCYTGDLDFALTCIKHGFYISWSGILTYNKNDHFRQFAAKLDIDRVLVETDCPFLAPQKYRGKRNEPSYVKQVAETLADCYGISFEEMARITTENAERLFAI